MLNNFFLLKFVYFYRVRLSLKITAIAVMNLIIRLRLLFLKTYSFHCTRHCIQRSGLNIVWPYGAHTLSIWCRSAWSNVRYTTVLAANVRCRHAYDHGLIAKRLMINLFFSVHVWLVLVHFDIAGKYVKIKRILAEVKPMIWCNTD